jgi:hypothetical protein
MARKEKKLDKDKDYVTGLFGEKYKKYNKMTKEEKRNSNWKNFLWLIVAVGLFLFLGPRPIWLLIGYGILLGIGFLYCIIAGTEQPSKAKQRLRKTSSRRLGKLTIIVIIAIAIAGVSIYFVLKSRGEGTSKKLSQMLLELGDLPQGYTLVENGERLSSDISKEGIELGWKKGHYAIYTKTGTYEFTEIDHYNSVYPLENISEALHTISHENIENWAFEEISKPNIGDDSRAWRVTGTFEGITYSGYQICFIKMNVYNALYMDGTEGVDYELLKDLARTVESKISMVSEV